MLETLAGEDGLDPRQTGVTVTPYVDGLDRGPDGLRVGVLREGFELPGLSESDVDAAVRDAVDRLAEAGATVEEVSVPLHRDGLAIWNGVAMEGATDLMVRGDAFGTNHKGHYTTDLVDFYGRARRVRAQDYSVTVKLTMLLGHYLSESYNHHYYAKAQNLGRRLRDAYGATLAGVDVLALPTTPMKAMRIPPPGASIGDVLTAALSNIANTAPFDVTGNPAVSVPCAFSDGLPVGLMLVGRPFDDATVLRAGHAFETVRGELETGTRAAAAAA
jgi:amidase